MNAVLGAFARPLALAAWLAGCQWGTEVPPERIPRFEAPSAAPRVALVLGSGGPRGFAHIGVLKALEDHGIRPDLVVGSSVGAMVGAIYAAGHDARSLEKLAEETNLLEFFEWRMITGGPASGRAVQSYVNERLEGRPIEALPLAFAAAATRVRDGELVLFNRGDAGLAVRASGASPGDFEPVRVGGELYVDGDEASPVPIRAARRLGAQVVIAVDVSAYPQDTPPGVPREWVEKDARRARQVAAEAPAADVLLHPNIGYYAGHTSEYRRRVIARAEAYTRERIGTILAAVARAQKSPTAQNPAGVASR